MRKNKCAGDDWYLGLRKWYPNVSLRKPEGLSTSRAQAFSKERVNDYYKTIATLLKDVDPRLIINIDETGLMIWKSNRKGQIEWLAIHLKQNEIKRKNWTILLRQVHLKFQHGLIVQGLAHPAVAFPQLIINPFQRKKTVINTPSVLFLGNQTKCLTFWNVCHVSSGLVKTALKSKSALTVFKNFFYPFVICLCAICNTPM